MYYTNIQHLIDITVAPRAGAWIEILPNNESYRYTLTLIKIL